MVADFIVVLDQFSQEVLYILMGLLFITSVIFMWLWFMNRKSYHSYKHHIPASVVKSYLDSVINNSVNLKSALFRGGGQDIDVTQLVQANPVAGSGANDQLVAQKNSEILKLQSELNLSKQAQRELEEKLKNASSGAGAPAVDIKPYQDRIKELEAQLEALKASAGAGAGSAGLGDAQLKTELSRMTKERDELKEKLREYEIIEDDLANLKRLQQENAQLKNALQGMGGTLPETSDAPVAEPVAAQAPVDQATANMEAFLSASDEAEKLDQTDLDKMMEEATAQQKTTEAEIAPPAAEAAAQPAGSGTKPAEKTPEDLLSEFEKMLG